MYTHTHTHTHTHKYSSISKLENVTLVCSELGFFLHPCDLIPSVSHWQHWLKKKQASPGRGGSCQRHKNICILPSTHRLAVCVREQRRHPASRLMSCSILLR